MAAQPTQQGPLPPRRTHYVSMINNGIYPALSSPSGYEDAHPEAWRPASPDEIAKYKAGAENADVVEVVDLTPVGDDLPPPNASPVAITLAPDDPPETTEAAPNIPPAPAPVMSRQL